MKINLQIEPTGFIQSIFRKKSFYLFKVDREKEKSHSISIQKVKILGKNENECLQMPINNFIYFQTEGHYTEVWYLKNETLKHTVIRQSFKEMNRQLRIQCPNQFIPVHRNIAVNKNNIKDVDVNNHDLILDVNFRKIPISKGALCLLSNYIK